MTNSHKIRIASKFIPAMVVFLGVWACGPMGVIGPEGVGEAPATGGDTGGGVSLSPYITNGQNDSGHPSVGYLKSGGSVCTATLIGKRTVLTAGHCVKTYGSSSIRLGGQTYHSSQIIRHPSYGGGNQNDVAVIILSQPVNGIKPTPVANFVPQNGQQITLVGFGKTGEYSGGVGTKRMTTNTIGKVRSTTFSFYGSKNAANGDSGGPTFVMHNGQEVTIGVHSTKSGACGNGGTDMRVDTYLNWIKQVANGDVVLPGSGGGGGGGGAPNPGGPGPIIPPEDKSIAKEGQGCWKRKCQKGLVCVPLYYGNNTTPGSKFCMERCASLGKDKNCDGGETCTQSKAAGKVCFAANNPKGGYTSGGPGSNPGAPPPGGGAPPPGGGGGGGGSCGNATESATFNLLNQARAKYGRGALKCDLAGLKAARAHSQWMCSRKTMSHTGKNGSSAGQRLKAAGASFSSWGENIARGYSGPQSVHNGWMNSSGHRSNMLKSSFTRAAVGMVPCNGHPYWTQVFMR